MADSEQIKRETELNRLTATMANARNGKAASQFALGQRYETGDSLVACNQDLAFDLYQKAAMQGHLPAVLRLAYCFENGIGTGCCMPNAFSLYQGALTAAKSGPERAMVENYAVQLPKTVIYKL